MSNNFSAKYRIYYEDTDAGGIVYYGNYLKFYERARTDFLRSLNISQFDLTQKENLIFVVRKCVIDYLAPSRLDDVVEVSAKVTRISTTSLSMYQEVKKDDKILSTLDVEIVCIDKTIFRPKKIPQNIKDLLNV